MIGLDTNVLVRYLTQDDPDQAARATRVVEQELTADTPGFIGLVVLVETAWVLQRLYRASAEEIQWRPSSNNIVCEGRFGQRRRCTGEEPFGYLAGSKRFFLVFFLCHCSLIASRCGRWDGLLIASVSPTRARRTANDGNSHAGA
jgi:hypothetical protein